MTSGSWRDSVDGGLEVVALSFSDIAVISFFSVTVKLDLLTNSLYKAYGLMYEDFFIYLG